MNLNVAYLSFNQLLLRRRPCLTFNCCCIEMYPISQVWSFFSSKKTVHNQGTTLSPVQRAIPVGIEMNVRAWNDYQDDQYLFVAFGDVTVVTVVAFFGFRLFGLFRLFPAFPLFFVSRFSFYSQLLKKILSSFSKIIASSECLSFDERLFFKNS